MLRTFDDFFTDTNLLDFPRLGNYSRKKTPTVDIIEQDEQYLIKLTAPGYKKEDINIEVEDNYLVVQGQTAEQEEGRYLRRERAHEAFYRKLMINENINPDEIKATLDDGILSIRLKKQNQKLLKTVQIE